MAKLPPQHVLKFSRGLGFPTPVIWSSSAASSPYLVKISKDFSGTCSGAVKIYNKVLFFHLKQGWPTSQRPTATFFYCVTAKSYIIRMGTHEHHPSFPPSLSHTHAHKKYTHLCSARFIVNVTHQHDNDRNGLLQY